MGFTVADALVALHADWATFNREVAKGGPGTAAAVDTAGRSAGQRFTQAFNPQAIQRTFTAVGAGGGAIFTAAVGGATKFEDQLRTINTVAKLPEDTLKGIGNQILDLSKETGKSTDDLTSGFYDLVSAGVPADQAIGVLRDSAKFATGALGTTAEAVDVVTSAMNAYGLKAGDSTRITDVFAQAVADGKVTASELGASIANIAPIASSAGISIEEVSAGFAVLTAKGVPASQAATEMRASIAALLTPNAQLNALQTETGINFAKLAKEKGLAVALDAIRSATTKNLATFTPFAKMAATDLPGALAKYGKALGLTEAGSKSFKDAVAKDGLQAALADLRGELGAGDEGFAKALGSVEAYQFALAATGDNADAFSTELGKVTTASTEGGVAQDQYAEKMKSAQSQGEKLVASLRATAIQIGGPFVGAFGPALTALDQFGGGLNGIFSLSKLVGGGIGAIAGKLIGVLVPGILASAPAAAGAGEAVGGATAAAIPLGMALLPVLLVGAIVAAILFLANNPDVVDKIIKFGEDLVQTLIGAISHLPELIGQVLGALPGILSDQLPKVAGVLVRIGGRILQAFVDLGTQLPGIFGTVLGALLAALPGFVGSVVGFILSIPGKLVDLAPRLFKLWASIELKILGIAGDIARSVVGFILSIPGKVAPLVAGLAGQAGKAGAGLFARLAAAVGRGVGVILGLPGRAVAWVTKLLAGAARAATGFVGKVTAFVGSAVALVLGLPARAAAWIPALLAGVGRAAAGFVLQIAGLATSVVQTILGIPARVGGLVGDFAGIARRAVEAFLGFIRDIPGKVASILGGVGDFIGGIVPHFSKGTMWAPQGLAFLHEGEIVVPREQSDAIRSGGAMATGARRGGAITASGTATVRVEHDLTPEAAAALRKVGYDERAVAGALADVAGLYSSLRQAAAMTSG